MEIKVVSFGRTINNGNYENSRYDLTAEIHPGENVCEVISQLSELVDIADRSPRHSTLLSKLNEEERQIRSTIKKLYAEAQELREEVETLKDKKQELVTLFASLNLEDSKPELCLNNNLVDDF
ncbi:MAG: hypothetical protein RLZZ86_332 [Cyanobacteriota bacterium]|jgi:predicted RNase H-like nuclease (RuvC/YqgF family)